MSLTKDELFTSIKSEIDVCETTKLPMNPSFAATEHSRLDLIDKYMMSKFRDANTDPYGSGMVFFNISSFPVEVASKMIDFDTKDILLVAEDERYWETWLMEKELRFWMEEESLGKVLNSFARKLPRDGHIIAKNVDGEIDLVPLKNLRFRPNALELENTPIIEKYEYAKDEFVEEAKKRGWENWEKVSLSPQNVKDGYFNRSDKITCFGAWFPQGYLGEGDNYFLVSYDGQVLYHSKEDIFYKGLRWDKVEGRLLGRGVVESLFQEQIYLNRIANYKADGLNWTSKHLWQTRDVSFKTNLLGNTDNGDVFITNDPIDPVQMEERNLAFYNQEEQRWQHNAMERVFSVGPVTGDWSPSGTRVGVSALQAKMTAGFYDQKKEDLGMFIKEILWDWVLPEFKKDKKGQHSLMMKNILTSDKGAEKLFNLQLNFLINKQKFTTFLPQEMWDMKKALLAEELKNKKIEIPRGFYDDLKYKMKIVLDSESMDTQSKTTMLQTLFQIIGSNPSVLQNKMTKNILFKMLSLSGFNPHDFEDEDVPTIQGVSQQAQAQRGGSIAAPVMPTIPQQVPQEVTL